MVLPGRVSGYGLALLAVATVGFFYYDASLEPYLGAEVGVVTPVVMVGGCVLLLLWGAAGLAMVGLVFRKQLRPVWLVVVVPCVGSVVQIVLSLLGFVRDRGWL